MKYIVAFGVKVKVPDWVKYAAQDEDGEVWAYEKKPFLRAKDWHVIDGRYTKIMRRAPSIHPVNTLIERV